MPDPAQLAAERAAINAKLRGLAPPDQAQPQPQPVDTAPFSFGAPQQIPDIQSLIRAMLKSGLTGSRTADIELKPSLAELLQRAQQLTGPPNGR